jgi:hypothetical protein
LKAALSAAPYSADGESSPERRRGNCDATLRAAILHGIEARRSAGDAEA